MKRLCGGLLIGGAGLLLAGCGFKPPIPPQTPPTDFNTFVKDLVAQKADDTTPVDVDEIEFEFNEDEAAFDDLFQDG